MKKSILFMTCFSCFLEADCSLYTGIDYILWFANEDGLSYATKTKTTLPVNDFTSLSETDKFLKNGWQSGVRGTLGIELPLLDTNLSYTYYKTTAQETSSADSDSIHSSSTDSSAGTIFLNDASYQLFQQFPCVMQSNVSANWSLVFDRLDLEFGKNIPLATHFSLKPFLGVEGLYIHQKLQGEFLASTQSLDTGLPLNNVVQTYNKEKFLSIGSRVGVYSTFIMKYGFSLTGLLAGSILWGTFTIDQTFQQTQEGDLLAKETIDHSHYASIFNCDIGAWFNWKHTFTKSLCALELKIGWEQHIYTNINQFQDFYASSINSEGVVYAFDRNIQHGDLSLSGLVFGISCSY